MTLAKDIALYSDVAQVLDTALEAGGALYTPDGSPHRWVQRAYRYRLLLRRNNASVLGNVGATPTRFDRMNLRIKDTGDIEIKFNQMAQGNLRSLDGKVLDLGEPPEVKEVVGDGGLSPLMNAAAELLQEKAK